MVAPFHKGREAWTPEREAILRQLHIKGFSASQIAKKLGGTTRNAVIGKCHRLGLLRGRQVNLSAEVMKARLDARTKNKARRSAISPSKLLRLAHPVAPKVATAPHGTGVSILALDTGMCRWPTGENGAHLFCGHPWTGEHGPYCATHAAVAYVKVIHRIRPPREPRRRSRSLDWLEAA